MGYRAGPRLPGNLPTELTRTAVTHTVHSRRQPAPGALGLGRSGGRLQGHSPPSSGPGGERVVGTPVRDQLAERVGTGVGDDTLAQRRRAGSWLVWSDVYFREHSFLSFLAFFFFTFSLTNSVFISVGPERPTVGDLASGLLSKGRIEGLRGQEEEPGGSSDRTQARRASEP